MQMTLLVVDTRAGAADEELTKHGKKKKKRKKNLPKGTLQETSPEVISFEIQGSRKLIFLLVSSFTMVASLSKAECPCLRLCLPHQLLFYLTHPRYGRPPFH